MLCLVADVNNTGGGPLPAVCRLGDMSTGHGCWPARPNDQGSPNVFANGLPIHAQGMHWLTHCCVTCHDGFLSTGSASVFVNGRQAGRVTDPISCLDFVAQGSPNVFVGGGAGGTGGGPGEGGGPATWDTVQGDWADQPATWDAT